MDAACGPSNGIKSLQQHFERDQSRHQSRIHATSGTSQFRDAPTQATIDRAAQDHASFLNTHRQEVQHIPPQQQQQQQNHSQRNAPQPLGSWAQEFHHVPIQQRLSGARVQQQQQQQQQPQALGSWAPDFLAAATTTTTNTMTFAPSLDGIMMQQQQLRPSQMYMPYSTMSAASPSVVTQANTALMSVEAFDAAFAEAEASLHQATLDSSVAQEQLSRGMDDIETREQVDRRFEADALADTAGELITALRNETSDKFRNSNFMALMHKLRDREVVVEENKMVDAKSGAEIGEHQQYNVGELDERNLESDHV